MNRDGALLDFDGQLTFGNFEELMRDQIKQFVQRQLVNTLTVGPQYVAVEAVQLSTMKAILHEQAKSADLGFSVNYCPAFVPPEECLYYFPCTGRHAFNLVRLLWSSW